jgi:5'-deoxynucleotidase YfbR-like HD superfamily hydrolase
MLGDKTLLVLEGIRRRLIQELELDDIPSEYLIAQAKKIQKEKLEEIIGGCLKSLNNTELEELIKFYEKEEQKEKRLLNEKPVSFGQKSNK